jgi:ATP-dependent Clp protease ATP-binding subunit ClpB
VGSHFIQELGSGKRDEMERRVMDALRSQFKPEFLNRIDETIIFFSLDRSQIGAIVDIQMQRLLNRLADQKITLELTDTAKELLIENGYDPIYGARPLKRAIQHFIENPLAMEILKGNFGEGATLRVDARGGSMVFHY